MKTIRTEAVNKYFIYSRNEVIIMIHHSLYSYIYMAAGRGSHGYLFATKK